MLQDRVVYRDSGECVIDLFEHLCFGRRSYGAVVADEEPVDVGSVVPVKAGDRLRGPDEHAAVPDVVPGRYILLSRSNIRLLFEAEDLVNLDVVHAAVFFRHLDVSIARGRSGGLDSDSYNVGSFGRDQFPDLKQPAEVFFFGDHVIGGSNQNDCVRIFFVDQGSYDSNRRRGVFAHRFSHVVFFREPRELFPDCLFVRTICYHVDVLTLDHGFQAANSLLQERVLGVEVLELLWFILAGFGP